MAASPFRASTRTGWASAQLEHLGLSASLLRNLRPGPYRNERFRGLDAAHEAQGTPPSPPPCRSSTSSNLSRRPLRTLRAQAGGSTRAQIHHAGSCLPRRVAASRRVAACRRQSRGHEHPVREGAAPTRPTDVISPSPPLPPTASVLQLPPAAV